MKDIKNYFIAVFLSVLLTSFAAFCFVSGRYVLRSEFEEHKLTTEKQNSENQNHVMALVTEKFKHVNSRLDALNEGQRENNRMLRSKVDAGEIVDYDCLAVNIHADDFQTPEGRERDGSALQELRKRFK